MDHNDRNAIQGLFGKLAEAERQAPPRDTEAEHFISDQIARQPGAPYYMAQTIVVQEHALNAAQARIEELEARAQQTSQGGGFLSRMFGGGAPQPQQPLRRQPPPQGHGGQPGAGMSGGGMAGGPFQNGRSVPGQGGGFLAGAAQTAMGVAGGVLLGNAVMGMFGSEAEAAPPPAEEEEELADAGFDEGGWDEE